MAAETPTAPSRALVRETVATLEGARQTLRSLAEELFGIEPAKEPGVDPGVPEVDTGLVGEIAQLLVEAQRLRSDLEAVYGRFSS